MTIMDRPTRMPGPTKAGRKYAFAHGGYLLTVGVAFYLMNAFTPLFSDDWHYNFIYGTNEQIRTFTDVLRSQYIHYFNANGRFVPHFFVQIFDGILGKEVFDIVNTGVFIAFIYLLSIMVKKEYHSLLIPSSLAAWLIFFLMPGFGYCFLWMSGACNYLWTATLLLLFCLMMEKEYKKAYTYPLLFIFGIICGWTHEAISVSLGAGFLVGYMVHKKKPRPSEAMLLSGLFVGILFLVLSPGSIHRAMGEGKQTFDIVSTLRNMGAAILTMGNIRILPLLAVSLIVAFALDKKWTKTFYRQHIVEITAIAISFVFVLWTQHDSSQSRFGFEFFSLLLLMKVLARVHWRKAVILAANAMLLCCTVYALSLAYKNHEDYKKCIDQITHSDSKVILTNNVRTDAFFKRFVIHFNVPETSSRYSPYNNFIDRHFRKDSLCFLPEEFYKTAVSGHDTLSSFHIEGGKDFYAKEIGQEEVKGVVLKLKQTDFDSLPFYIRPFAHQLSKYTLTEIRTGNYSVVTIKDKNYIIVNRNPDFDQRLREIIIE